MVFEASLFNRQLEKSTLPEGHANQFIQALGPESVTPKAVTKNIALMGDIRLKQKNSTRPVHSILAKKEEITTKDVLEQKNNATESKTDDKVNNSPVRKMSDDWLPEKHGTAQATEKSLEKKMAARDSGQVLAPSPVLKEAQLDYAYSPKPVYPPALREAGIGGVVWLKVWVSADGKPENILISRASGYRLLDAAAQDAVARWRFFPAHQGNKVMASWVEFPIRFSMQI